MKITEKINVIGHCRVSSSKQAQEGESLDVQEGIVRAHAERNNWNMVRVWHESYSGRKESRPVFNEILAYLDSHPGQIEYYVFRTIDRFTRGGTGMYDQMRQELLKRGVAMVDTSGMIQKTKNTLEDLDFEYSWSRHSPSEITEVVVATTSKHEVTNIETRMIGQEIRLTQQGYKVRQQQDGFLNTKIYDTDGKKRTVMIEDPDRAKYHRAMFELRAEGQLSDPEIVERINAMGYRSRAHKKWDKSHTKILGHGGGKLLTVKHLQEIIQRPIYAGFICEKWTRYKPVKAKFDGLVSLDTFNKANRGKVFIEEHEDGTYGILYDYHPDRAVVTRMRDNPLFPYKSVVMCPECGMPFMGSRSRSKSGRPVPYYHCNRKHKWIGFNKAAFEEIVENYAHSVRFWPDKTDTMKATLIAKYNERKSEISKEIVSVGESVADLEIQKRAAVDAFKTATGDVMRRELEKDIEQLDAQINGSNVEHAKLKVTEADIDVFVEYAKNIMEHPAEALLNTVNTRQQESLYSIVFDELPTITQMVNGTPKLSWIFRLSQRSETPESVLAGPPGIGPGLSVLETDVLPLYDGPEERQQEECLHSSLLAERGCISV
jgi:site-specific DNA recombinase